MFTTDSKTENYLRSKMAVKHEYRESVKYDELIDSWNVENLGRPAGQQRVTDAILTYAEMMKEGSAAPAVLLRSTPNGLEVLDGTQRLQANRENDSTHFAAYVLTCSNETARKIRRAANLWLNTAAPVDANWVLRELIEEFMIHGTDTARDIADVTGRRVGEIERLHRRLMAGSRVRNASHAVQGSAGPVLNEAVLDTIAAVAVAEDFDGPQAEPVVKFLNALAACKFRNGDAIHHAEAFFNIKRTGNKNRVTQYRTKLRQFMTDAIVQGRLGGSRKQTGVEAIDTKLKALVTVCKRYKQEHVGEIDDLNLVKSWDDNLSNVCRILRECCSNKARHTLDPFH